MIEKVLRDMERNIINIGAWELQKAYVELEDGSVIEIDTNPVPPGTVWSQEEVVIGWDGGRYVKGDPRATSP